MSLNLLYDDSTSYTDSLLTIRASGNTSSLASFEQVYLAMLYMDSDYA